jgi:formate dehydrogenase subunit gamma
MRTINNSSDLRIRIIRTFPRFSLSQRWEHVVLLLSVSILFITGILQKYNTTLWSQQILSTPQRLENVQNIHRIAAILLILETVYHLGKALILIFRRKMSADMFPNGGDILNAWQMVKYLFFLTKEKPKFGKYNFEQKITYWFIFFAVGIMAVTGIILWFPEIITRFLPGGVIPAALLAHSNEAIVLAVFVVIWHFFHVHVERLNLSIFTGWLNEEDMRKYHEREYEQMSSGDNQEEQENLQTGGKD